MSTERGDTSDVKRRISHDEFEPIGTLILVVLYFLVIFVMWFVMYFIEFLGKPVVID